MSLHPNIARIKSEPQKGATPSIQVQKFEPEKNADDAEVSFYGQFRSIVKQRYFQLKLEEGPFMEYVESNKVPDQPIKANINKYLGNEGRTGKLYRFHGSAKEYIYLYLSELSYKSRLYRIPSAEISRESRQEEEEKGKEEGFYQLTGSP